MGPLVSVGPKAFRCLWQPKLSVFPYTAHGALSDEPHELQLARHTVLPAGSCDERRCRCNSSTVSLTQYACLVQFAQVNHYEDSNITYMDRKRLKWSITISADMSHRLKTYGAALSTTPTHPTFTLFPRLHRGFM